MKLASFSRLLVATIVFGSAGSTVRGALQLADQEELRRRHAGKLESAFLQANPWLTDFDQAKEAARNPDRLILAYFTRSYEK